MNEPVAVSVIIPIFNSQDHLVDCLNSLKIQARDDVEFILVDDGSTDGSGDIARQYLSDNRFVYYRKSNGGAASARNLGIKNSKGRYLVFVDSDDVVHDRFVEHLLGIAIESNADIVSGKKQNFDDCFEQGPLDKKYIEVNAIELLKNGFSCCARMFKRELFFSPEILFPEGVWAEDNGYVPYLAGRAEKNRSSG